MNRKMLIVDDEIEFAEIIKVRMEANNYKVVLAHTGEEALDKIAKEKPSVVLLDVMMPGLNGLDVLDKIRKSDKRLPVFITTAFSSEERFKMANELNASGFILKTDNIKEQVKSINAAVALYEKYQK